MKKFYHLILLNFFLVCTVVSSNAKIRLPEIIGSNMVLQRNTTVKIWGWATPNEKISAKMSWVSNAIKVVANANGKWEFSVATTLSKTPQTIHLNSPESDIDLTNILFGEVWVCSGQSNMRMPLKGYTGQPTFDGNRAIAKASNPNLRLFSIKEMGSPTELDSVIGYKKWEQSSSENAKDFSAVAFFYGKQLQEILDVPVGLIMTSWGGTRIQPWISNETIGPLLVNFKTKKDTTEHYKRIPSAIYNAMIHPIINYSIKGVLWYQGETNRDEPKVYEQLFPLMVQDWRKKWNIGDFPFYYVQIAPNNYTDKSNSQLLREVQLNASQKIPNSGIAITADIGSDKTIHPPRKNEVAERLLFIALNQSYGMKNVDCVGPIYKAMEEKESGLFLSFDNAETGLFCSKEELSGFEIAGEDKVFYPAKAEIIKGKQIKVSNDIVKNPKAVRYGWSNWFEGSLFDNNMLPASSFRTDNWE